jgi:hypothetical protein
MNSYGLCLLGLIGLPSLFFYNAQQPTLKGKQHLPSTTAANSTHGRIVGDVSYPSDYLPDDLKVTAVPVNKGRTFSTTKRRGSEYSLSLPAGEYYVYATTNATPNMTGYKAYYTEFTTCGSSVDCPSHKKIVVSVKPGKTTYKVDPQDWYNNQTKP